MPLPFACESATEDTRSHLLAWLQSLTAPCLALIDPMLLDEAQRQQLFASHTLINGYEGTSLAAFGRHSPQLLALSDDPQLRTEQVAQMLELVGCAPALSWISTQYPADALQQLFGYLGKAQPDDRPTPVHCRFADVRILPGLLGDLSEAQQRRVADVVDDWGWADRYGQWQHWAGEKPPQPDSHMDPEYWLHLSVEQFASIGRRTEADEIFFELMQESEDAIAQMPMGQLHKRLLGCLETANTLRISGVEDRICFVRLCLEYGDNFHSYEQLDSIWAAVRKDGASLKSLLAEWPKDLWEILRLLA